MAEIPDAEKFVQNGLYVDEKHGCVQDIDHSSGDLTVLSEPSSFQKVRSWIRNSGAEEGGLERVPPEARTNQPPRDLFTIFMSVNVGVATLAFGTLGPSLFYLGWWDSSLCILFFNIIGSIPPAFMATFGPKLGLRTMVSQILRSCHKFPIQIHSSGCTKSGDFNRSYLDTPSDGTQQRSSR